MLSKNDDHRFVNAMIIFPKRALIYRLYINHLQEGNHPDHMIT